MARQETRTCRYCLGGGCLHCNKRGYIVLRTFSRSDMAAAKLRRAVFGEGHSERFTNAFVSSYGSSAR